MIGHRAGRSRAGIFRRDIPQIQGALGGRYGEAGNGYQGLVSLGSNGFLAFLRYQSFQFRKFQRFRRADALRPFYGGLIGGYGHRNAAGVDASLDGDDSSTRRYTVNIQAVSVIAGSLDYIRTVAGNRNSRVLGVAVIGNAILAVRFLLRIRQLLRAVFHDRYR